MKYIAVATIALGVSGATTPSAQAALTPAEISQLRVDLRKSLATARNIVERTINGLDRQLRAGGLTRAEERAIRTERRMLITEFRRLNTRWKRVNTWSDGQVTYYGNVYAAIVVSYA